MFDLTKIDDHFPMPSYRAGQRECVEFALKSFNDGKKFVFLECPVGSGKSAIGITIARFMNRSYYLTSGKHLQDQLTSEFGDSGSHIMVDMKGRSNYECTYYKKTAEFARANKIIDLKMYNEWTSGHHDCADGHCRRKGKYKYDECIEAGACPFYTQLMRAEQSNICLMNFHSFLYQIHMANRFGHRDLLIIDEGHASQPNLMDFISVSMSDDNVGGIKLPILSTPEAYVDWMVDIDLVTQLETMGAAALRQEEPKKADEYQSLLHKVEMFLRIMAHPDHSPWVVEVVAVDGVTRITFKPVFIHDQAHKHLFDLADRVLLMSATILDVNMLAKSLGIDRTELAAKRLSSSFPIKNRPIYYKPVVRVVGGNSKIDKWGPGLVKGANMIVRHHNTYKGIIHTHNFAIAKLLIEKCDKDVSSRFLFQENFKDKQEMLAVHAGLTNSVIVAPAMHEGVDLKDDLSRFQIIMKVPCPNFYDDKQLAARMAVDPSYISYITALKLCQSAGRSVRSETDWAYTYIIDEAFGQWYDNNVNLLPQWFKESLIFPS